jgi:hypothetical protein
MSAAGDRSLGELRLRCGVEPNNLAVMLDEPTLPAGLIEGVPVGDIPPASPRGSVH